MQTLREEREPPRPRANPSHRCGGFDGSVGRPRPHDPAVNAGRELLEAVSEVATLALDTAPGAPMTWCVLGADRDMQDRTHCRRSFPAPSIGRATKATCSRWVASSRRRLAEEIPMAPTPVSGGNHAPDEPYRLPRTVSPTHYRLSIDVDLESARFAGTAEIAARHARRGGRDHPERRRARDRRGLGRDRRSHIRRRGQPGRRQRAGHVQPRAAGTGWAGRLRCSFRGVLNDKLRGFYRSTFVDDDGRRTPSRPARSRRPTPGAPSRASTSPTARRCFEITLDRRPTALARVLERSPIVEETADRRRGARRSASRRPWSCRRYLVAFDRRAARGDRAPSTSTACRCGSSTSRARSA